MAPPLSGGFQAVKGFSILFEVPALSVGQAVKGMFCFCCRNISTDSIKKTAIDVFKKRKACPRAMLWSVSRWSSRLIFGFSSAIIFSASRAERLPPGTVTPSDCIVDDALPTGAAGSLPRFLKAPFSCHGGPLVFASLPVNLSTKGKVVQGGWCFFRKVKAFGTKPADELIERGELFFQLDDASFGQYFFLRVLCKAPKGNWTPANAAHSETFAVFI